MGIIYVAECLANGKKYVGQTIHSMAKRRAEHERDARNRPSFPFQRALAKHGPDAFVWSVYAECPDAELDRLEEEAIEWFGTMKPNGYNLTSGGDSPKNRADSYSHSPEAKAKIAAANRKRVWSAESRRRMSEAKTGHKWSEASKQKASQSHMGKKKTEAHKAAIGRANQGEKHGRAKLSVDDVLDIKLLRCVPAKEWAKMFVVHVATIRDVQTERTWRHV